MFHPTVPNLDNLTDDELVSKIEYLYSRQAFLRMHPARDQLTALIQHYTAELDRRIFNKKDKETG